MCTVLLPPGGNPIAVNKYIISHHISYIRANIRFFRPSDLFQSYLLPHIQRHCLVPFLFYTFLISSFHCHFPLPQHCHPHHLVPLSLSQSVSEAAHQMEPASVFTSVPLPFKNLARLYLLDHCIPCLIRVCVPNATVESQVSLLPLNVSRHLSPVKGRQGTPVLCVDVIVLRIQK